ncbi:hypothetical protein M758_8G172500 [Ceratodon purpureus]|nr:hypothetical protein M758_8G172500 [Ceratodon purpureus]
MPLTNIQDIQLVNCERGVQQTQKTLTLTLKIKTAQRAWKDQISGLALSSLVSTDGINVDHSGKVSSHPNKPHNEKTKHLTASARSLDHTRRLGLPLRKVAE